MLLRRLIANFGWEESLLEEIAPFAPKNSTIIQLNLKKISYWLDLWMNAFDVVMGWIGYCFIPFIADNKFFI